MPSKRILVVDDEPAVLEVISRVLSLDEHSITRAEDGEEALASLESASYDLAIVDLHLPGMSGDQLASQIHHRSGIPVILMSGSQLDALPPGVSSLLIKPFTVQELRQKLAEATLPPIAQHGKNSAA